MFNRFHDKSLAIMRKDEVNFSNKLFDERHRDEIIIKLKRRSNITDRVLW